MAFGSKENKTPVQVPAHIGIIMDGNGRWAKKRGLPRTAGHTAGAQNFRTITRYASSIGVKYLTLYAFSTENWSRPADEVSALMKLFHQYLEEALRDFMNENIRVRFIGDISAFAPDLQALIHRVVAQQRAENARRERGINKDICLLKFTELHQHGSCHAGNRDIPAVGKSQRLDDFKNSERGDKRNGNIECQRKRAVEHDDCHKKCDQRDTG